MGGARVLLVSTNRERQPYPVVPNGLACVASALDGVGHDVRFLDLCFSRNPAPTAVPPTMVPLEVPKPPSIRTPSPELPRASVPDLSVPM